MHKLIILIFTLFFSIVLSAQSNNQADTTAVKKNRLLELSFGQSLLFISEGKAADLHKNEAVVVPTSSALFFAEFRPLKKFRFPIYANIPTESK